MGILTAQLEKRASAQELPPLNNGDFLSRAEFEERYKTHPNLKKAELIEGVVYVSSPVSPRHGAIHGDIVGWMSVYRAATPGVRIFDNTSLRLDADNEPQPDVAVVIDADPDLIDEEYLETKPALIIEVAASSAAYDLHQKLHVYRRNGIQEYLVLLAHEQETRWHRWQEGTYTLLRPDDDGILRSQILPGLWFHSEHFWQGDLAGLFAILQQGLASADHQAFTQRNAKPTG
jgi:Uma2 family endonuclease